MKLNHNIRRPRATGNGGQRGYVLIVLLLMAALLVIGLAAAGPAIGTQIQRDREEELIHRGRQYAHAIKLFYKKFGRYPTSLKELENTNNVRFLRQEYKDPMAASGKWRLIHFGEQTSNATGLFGKPGGANQPQTGLNASTNLNPNSPAGTAGSSGNPATPVAQMGTLQPGGATFGGGPIVGVASTSKKSSIRVLNKKTHYNDWEFVYDPTQDVLNQLGGVAGQPGTPGQSPQSPTGPQSPGSGTFGMPSTNPNPAPSQGPAPSPGPAPAPPTQQ